MATYFTLLKYMYVWLLISRSWIYVVWLLIFRLMKYMWVWLLISRCWIICMYGYLFHAAETYLRMSTYFTQMKYIYVCLLISSCWNICLYGYLFHATAKILISRCFTLSIYFTTFSPHPGNGPMCCKLSRWSQ